MQADNIKTKKESSNLKTFIRFLLPTFGGVLISCIYSVTDTVFIGRYGGEKALNALNIVLPVYVYIYAIATFLGVGAGILYNVEKGRGSGRHNKYFTMAAIVLLAVSVVFSLAASIWFEPFMNFMGARAASNSAEDIAYAAERMALIKQYGMPVTMGIVIMAFNFFMNIMVRNDGAPNLAMIATLVSGAANILLNYLFLYVFDLGMRGAGIATLLAMLIGLLICVSHFLRRSCCLGVDFKGCGATIVRIAKSGFPNFVMDFAFGITMMMFNIQLQKYVGVYAVAVYGVVCGIIMVLASLLVAVSATLQPLVSLSYGQNRKDKINAYMRIALVSALTVSALSYTIIALRPNLLTGLFVLDPSQALLDTIPKAFWIYGSSIFFMGLNFVIGSFYQSSLRTMRSLIVQTFREVVFPLSLLAIVPLVMGEYKDLFWWIIPAAEIFTFVIIVILFIFDVKRRARTNAKL